MAAASAMPGVDNGPVRYVVKPGDTLSELAHRYVIPTRSWHDLMRLGHVRDPRRLPVGTTLAIPRAWLRWAPETARLASARGSVRLVVDKRPAAPAVGAMLGEGAEIATAADSFATLVLADGSRIALPSQSHVILTRLRKFAINGAIDYRLMLDQGRIDTHVTPLSDPSGHFIINTPLAMTAVRGTEYGVAFDPARQWTGTEVFKGAVSVSRPDGSAALLVPEHFGATTDASGQSRQASLLSAPDLRNAGQAQTDDLVTFDIAPMPGAAGYQIMLATDAGFVDTFAEQESPSPHFTVKDVPNGNQFVRVSAIAADGLVGLRQSYAFSRRLASVHAEVGATSDGYRFKWYGAGEGERHYRLQIFRDALDTTPVVDQVGLTQDEVTVRSLPAGIYLWRVAVVQTDSEGTIENWTRPEKLTIASPGGG